jgi:NADH-quinone oxidoreductase subunit M
MATSTDLQPDRPRWLMPTIVVFAVLGALFAGLRFFGHAEGSLALSRAIGWMAPLAVAGAVGALMPTEGGWRVRLPLAILAGLGVLMITSLWAPDFADIPDQVPAESHTILSWLVGLPIAGAIAILFLPRQAPRLLQATTLITMLVTLAASLPLLRVPMGRDFHFNQDVMWIESLGVRYHMALDGVSLWLVMLTLVTVPVATYVSFGSIHTRIKDWCFSLLLLEGAMLGAFVSLDLFLFYVFWELVLVPMYVMIGVWGGTNRIKAAVKFFLYTMFGSVLMLGAIFYLAYTYSKLTGGTLSFDYFDLQRVLVPRNVQMWLFFAFTLSFVIKVPMFPVHTWLPDAHTEAPTAGSIILAAVMLKLGTYGYLRFAVGLFPESAGEWAANLGGFAVLGGIIYGALCAWKQDDIKRLVAYSSVAHLGYVMLGIFAATQASMEGAVLQMVNHGISTGALFLLVGIIYDRIHTRQVDHMGGLAKPMPVYAALFVIATLASIGLPGTNGFIGEFMIITGTFVSTRLGHFSGLQAVGAAIGVILGALYMLTVVRKMFFGPITRPENKRLADATPRERLAVAPLIILIFVIGFFPNLLLSQMSGAVSRIRGDLESRLMTSPGPRYYVGPTKLLVRRPEAPPPPASPNAAPATGAAGNAEQPGG